MADPKPVQKDHFTWSGGHMLVRRAASRATTPAVATSRPTTEWTSEPLATTTPQMLSHVPTTTVITTSK